MKQITKLTALAIFCAPSFFVGTAQATHFGNSSGSSSSSGSDRSPAGNNQFDVCLEELTTSGVAIEDAQIGCADALNPKDLSYCVKSIANSTSIPAIDALKNCYQVRRPIDLGNCVVDINNSVLTTSTEASKSNLDKEDTPIMMALKTCRASLLPFRHSECVVALSRTPQVSNAIEAMKTCINAEDFPRDLYPAN